jgi:hypothetical protein
MMHPLLVQAVVIAATWDAWRWYFARIAAAPEEAAALGVLTLVLAVLGMPSLARARGPTCGCRFCRWRCCLRFTRAAMPSCCRSCAARSRLSQIIAGMH